MQNLVVISTQNHLFSTLVSTFFMCNLLKISINVIKYFKKFLYYGTEAKNNSISGSDLTTMVTFIVYELCVHFTITSGSEGMGN